MYNQTLFITSYAHHHYMLIVLTSTFQVLFVYVGKITQ